MTPKKKKKPTYFGAENQQAEEQPVNEDEFEWLLEIQPQSVDWSYDTEEEAREVLQLLLNDDIPWVCKDGLYGHISGGFSSHVRPKQITRIRFSKRKRQRR